jgi:hypothetical protein
MEVTVDTTVNSESILLLILGIMLAAVFIILIAKAVNK